MPEAAQDVTPEGAPVGRSAPGGGKIGPLPIWGWALVGVGLLGFFWWQRSHSGPGSSTATGNASNLPPDTGVTTTDPMTADMLFNAMQDLTARLGKTSVSPGPDTPGVQSISGGPQAIISNALNGWNGPSSKSGGGGINEGPPQVTASLHPTVKSMFPDRLAPGTEKAIAAIEGSSAGVHQNQAPPTPTAKIGPITFGADPSKGPWWPSFTP